VWLRRAREPGQLGVMTAVPTDLADWVTPPVRHAWDRLAAPRAEIENFDESMIVRVPAPVRRWLLRSIAPGTPLPRSVALEMEGRIRLGRWLPFRAVQLHSPPDGYIWAARVGLGPLRISGYDRYVDTIGQMRWRLFGRIPMISARGSDVDRSAAGRVALDAVFIPPAFLMPTISWLPDATSTAATADWMVGGYRLRPTLHFDADGALRSVDMARWAKPAGHPWGEYPCGGTLDDEMSFGGITIPTRMRVGYFFGTDRWPEGEFFQARIIKATFT
jgi:hypothetical protein